MRKNTKLIGKIREKARDSRIVFTLLSSSAEESNQRILVAAKFTGTTVPPTA